MAVIAGIDFMLQRQKWWKKQRMTQREIKDEYKQQEGDPQIKAKIRQLRQERARKRMMANVPDATVVITNPTHFAVALKYESSMGAPIVVAKGVDTLALKIREIARDSDVTIVENPPLARALYAGVDIDEAIPEEHFKAVAEVIGFVTRLNNRAAAKALG
jgi:flagellar biosynthetic protein FlhB